MDRTRRRFLTLGAAGAAAAACRTPPPAPDRLDPRSAYGDRSPFEKSAREFRPSLTPGTGSSRTPLQDTYGMITPSSLHFERHHAGVPGIDPASHELLIHGLVERPLVLTMKDLHRLPAVSRIHFIECSGNSAREHEGRPGPDPQKSHGLVSCSEWTGVPLAALLQEVGLKPEARWLVAEGADACRLTRSIPLDKALDDVLVAYGQNGEALRPAQGYPLRLVVPGWEGNVNVKWLRRMQVAAGPAMSREEAATYTDLMPDGKARMFSFVMEAKSVITRPAGGQTLVGPGIQQIEGLAWSGRGRISRVEVSTNGGHTWREAPLEEPLLPKAFTPFRLSWNWTGEEAVLQSRCTDETGYVQPTRDEIVAIRGMRSGPDGFDHYNGIKAWRVGPGGVVTHV
jgi:sulfane dehydrogenase subunit SoxC